MTTLSRASHEWAKRRDDERYLTLTALRDQAKADLDHSAEKVITTKMLSVAPVAEDFRGLVVQGPNGSPVAPTHWSIGQLATRVGVKGLDRDLPTPIVADIFNWKIKNSNADTVKVLLRRPPGEDAQLVSVTSPTYGRVRNYTIAEALVKRFGNGIDGNFRVPGIFGKEIENTKQDTTFYLGDRSMFVFLTDERNKIEIPNRRNGKPGLLSRGFFVWNSEVGSDTLGLATFLFDYVCRNRTVWGVDGYREFKIRHTSGAPDRWLYEMAPKLERYAQSSTRLLEDTIHAAQAKRIGSREEVEEFLLKRFTKSQTNQIQALHLRDEQRPIETLWDASVGVTAYAQQITWQDDRVSLERDAGKILDLVAA